MDFAGYKKPLLAPRICRMGHSPISPVTIDDPVNYFTYFSCICRTIAVTILTLSRDSEGESRSHILEKATFVTLALYLLLSPNAAARDGFGDVKVCLIPPLLHCAIFRRCEDLALIVNTICKYL